MFQYSAALNAHNAHLANQERSVYAGASFLELILSYYRLPKDTYFRLDPVYQISDSSITDLTQVESATKKWLGSRDGRAYTNLVIQNMTGLPSDLPPPPPLKTQEGYNPTLDDRRPDEMSAYLKLDSLRADPNIHTEHAFIIANIRSFFSSTTLALYVGLSFGGTTTYTSYLQMAGNRWTETRAALCGIASRAIVCGSPGVGIQFLNAKNKYRGIRVSILSSTQHAPLSTNFVRMRQRLRAFLTRLCQGVYTQTILMCIVQTNGKNCRRDTNGPETRGDLEGAYR